MENYTLYELKPEYSRQKSFYGKAIVNYINENEITLYSYNTPVIALENGEIRRLWGGWSATTSKHIREFLLQTCGVILTKKEWDSMPVINTL